jgi:hypothetical protein
MKKYIITEGQLEKLVNSIDERDVKFSELPKASGKDLGGQKELTFQEFITQSEKDQQNDPNAGAPDTKLNVQAQVSANRAGFNINKTDQALKNIAGKFYKQMYSLAYDPDLMSIPEGLAAIVLTLAYSFDGKAYPDFKINYLKNVNYLQNNLRKITTDGSLKTIPTGIYRNPTDPEDILIYTLNNTVVIHVNSQKLTKKVEFGNIDPQTISKIENFFKDINNIDIVNKAIGRKIVSVKSTGNNLVVKF